MTELTALQNASSYIDGAQIHEKYTEDKRKTIKQYFMTVNGVTVSPVLDYENLNHFILGFIKGTKRAPIQLTEEQYSDLVNGIVVAIKNTADIGMEDMGEVRETAEQTVNDWANKFNIQLP